MLLFIVNNKMWVIIVVGTLTILILLTAAIIDFFLSRQQKNNTNKNSLVASGAMTIIAAGIALILMVFGIHLSKKKAATLYPHPVTGSLSGSFTGTYPGRGVLSGMTPEAQTQLIKSGFDYAQNNPAMAMAALKGFS